MFRIFRPEPLREISRDRSSYRELLYPLTTHGVIGIDAPQLLGVYLRLYDYAAIQDSNLTQKRSDQYLFSLIGIRLIMKTLTGILALKGLDLSHLHRITVGKPQDHCIVGLSLPCDGKKLYTWASNMEQDICGVINRFDISDHQPYNLSHDTDYMYVISCDNLLFDGQPVISKILVLLDDLHELTKSQRKIFLDKIIPARLPISIWIAERLEALTINELFSDDGRESNTIYLERHWYERKSFENFVKSISVKRVKLAPMDFAIDLHQHLEGNIATTNRNRIFRGISNKIKKRIHSAASGTRTYDKWIDEQRKPRESEYENAVGWRMLEIKIAREKMGAQTKLLDIPLDPDLDYSDSGLRAAAEFFLHNEFKTPYFFGFSSVSKMATFNVEVFLKIAADLFDELLSQRIKNKNHEILDAESQEEIVKKIANKHFEQISQTNKNGRDIAAFLSAFQQFAREQTVRPNAPYVPGVTGIGISREQYERLINFKERRRNENYDRLVEVLRSCISHNYLWAHYYARQGRPGRQVVVLYLNRLFCAHFDLPLGMGGWRRKTPDELCEWLDLSVPEKKERQKLL